jgi:hypothetical protein
MRRGSCSWTSMRGQSLRCSVVVAVAVAASNHEHDFFSFISDISEHIAFDWRCLLPSLRDLVQD